MNVNHLFVDLHQRMQDMPENFRGFVESECGWGRVEYYRRLRNPHRISPEEEKKILKIAHALAVDLLALIGRHRKP